MRAAQLAGLGERVQVGAGGNGGHAKGLGDFCHLHRGVMFEHFHDGGTTLIGEARVVAWAIAAPFSTEICRNCVESIFVHFLLSKKTPFDYLSFL